MTGAWPVSLFVSVALEADGQFCGASPRGAGAGKVGVAVRTGCGVMDDGGVELPIGVLVVCDG